MVEMLKTETRNPEVARIVEKYGEGFDVIYFDGKADGINQGFAEGRTQEFADGINQGFADGRTQGFADGKVDVAKNLLAEGFDEEVISRSTGISIDNLKELKRKL